MADAADAAAVDGSAVARPFAVAGRVLRDERRTLIGWTIALAIVTAIYASFYSAMGETSDFAALIEGLPEAYVSVFNLDQISSAAGYLSSTVFGLLGPALLLVFGISAGGRLLAGVEEDGSLELELTAPVSRRRIVAERLLTLAGSVLWLVIVIAAVTAAMVVAQGLDIAVSNVLATSLGLFLLTVAFAALALAVGAATGRRAIAVGTAAGLAVLAYIADAVAPLSDRFGWLTDVSPFGWYLGGEPMRNGVDAGGYALLVAFVAVAAVVALVGIERRDLAS